MKFDWFNPQNFFGSIAYALVGVVVFWLCFVIIDKITPRADDEGGTFPMWVTPSLSTNSQI